MAVRPSAQVLGCKAPGSRGDAELAPALRLLAKVPFTAELAEGLQLRLARALLWVPLAPGCALFHEGDPGEHWYILVSGARGAAAAPSRAPAAGPLFLRALGCPRAPASTQQM